MNILLKMSGDKGQWEEVDQFTLEHKEKAVLPNGQPRYTGDYVVSDGGDVRIHGHISTTELGRICRYLNIVPTNNIVQHIDKPSHIPFCLRRGKANVTLRDMGTGQLYKQVKVIE